AQRLDQLALRLGRPARSLQGAQQRVAELGRRLQRALSQRLVQRGDELPRLAQRLMQAAHVRLEASHLRLAAAEQRWQANDPHRILRRGYAWVEGGDGRPVVSALALRPGQSVRAVWADGSAQADITAVEAGTGRDR
ncbi:MAG: exodeoxyribonuclease VII large subunit, partial [Burkholderiales bacterium]|nr:exodeoxyribonuclease VII large subunit [Burkholderiales bacterium]